MKNINTNSTARTAKKNYGMKVAVVGAALSIALVGGFAIMPTRAMAAEASNATTSQQATFNWAAARDGYEAASNVGLARFSVPAEVTLGDLHYKDAKFAYAGGVAQATYETPATQLVIRKAVVDSHEAPLTDRKDNEFAQKYERDIDDAHEYEADDAHLTILGATQDKATVVTWKDGIIEYGITFQGLGGEEMSMNMDEVTNLVKSIRDLNAVPKQDATQQATNQQAANQKATSDQKATTQQSGNQQAKPQQQADTKGLISKDKAIAIATSYVAGDNNVSNLSCELSSASTEPRYVVTFHFDDADYIVKVGARDGSVWYATEVFNDGTTRDFKGNSVTNNTDDDATDDHDADDRYDADHDDKNDVDDQHDDADHDDHDGVANNNQHVDNDADDTYDAD